MNRALLIAIIIVVLIVVGVILYFVLKKPPPNPNGGNNPNACNVWTLWSETDKSKFPSWAIQDASGAFAPAAQQMSGTSKMGYAQLSGSPGFSFWNWGNDTKKGPYPFTNTYLIKRDPSCPPGLQFAKTSDKYFKYTDLNACLTQDKGFGNGMVLMPSQSDNNCGQWNHDPKNPFAFVADDSKATKI